MHGLALGRREVQDPGREQRPGFRRALRLVIRLAQDGGPPGERALAVARIRAIAASRDLAAFRALFDYFAPRVKAYLMRLGATDGVAEELAQETLLTVWRKADRFDPEKAGASTWIFTIARNLRIDALRRESFPMPDSSDAWMTPPPGAEEKLGVAELEERLRQALAVLPEEQAAVVRLSFFQDKPHSEIERDLGIPLGTVKSRLRLAMSRMRSLLAGDL